MKNVGNNSRGRSQGVPKIIRARMYRAHCAVIFAIAQLSCCLLLAHSKNELIQWRGVRRLSVCPSVRPSVNLRKSLLLAGKWPDRHQTFTRWTPGQRASSVCSRSRSRSRSKVTWYAHFLEFLEWATPSLTVWFLYSRTWNLSFILRHQIYVENYDAIIQCPCQRLKQESCAIAKMTAQCALHMGALKIFGTVWLRPRPLFPTFSWAFVPIDSINVPTKFEVRSFTHSWDNRGYPKNLGSPWIRSTSHAPSSPKFWMAFTWIGPVNVPAKFEVRSFTCSLDEG